MITAYYKISDKELNWVCTKWHIKSSNVNETYSNNCYEQCLRKTLLKNIPLSYGIICQLMKFLWKFSNMKQQTTVTFPS